MAPSSALMQLGGEDRLSMLIDDILMSILEKVDITTAVRASALSTRWKHLPWLLPELTIDVKDFLPVLRPNPIKTAHMFEAMLSFTEATRSFLASPGNDRAITKLQLKLYSINNYVQNIGPQLSKTIDMGILKDLDLAILDEKEIPDCTDEQMLHQARVVNGFFTAFPSVLHCITRLSLYNLCFAEWDMHHHLFVCCKQLRHLTLSNCGAAMQSVWKINAPDSKLTVLELEFCWLGGLEVLCLPQLETTPLGCLVMPLWIQPEGKQFCTAFNNLRKLSLHGIFVEFDLLWTIVLLEAAPSLEIFDIEVWEHPCQTKEHRRFAMERTSLLWKLCELTSSSNSFLKELQIIDFRPLKQQLTFIKAVMERAPNLRTVVLKYDDPCEAIGIFPPRPSIAYFQ